MSGQAVAPTADHVQTLGRWSRSTSVSHRLVVRSRIVLRLLEGQSQAAVARELQVSRDTVSRWRRRFDESGLEGLMTDKAGRGRRPGRNVTHVARVLALLRLPPPPGAVRWTVRLLARRSGVSASTVQRVWRDHADGRTVTGQILTQPPQEPRRSVDLRCVTREPGGAVAGQAVTHAWQEPEQSALCRLAADGGSGNRGGRHGHR